MAAQNQLLQQHLQETTSSFREALQLVESLMGGEGANGYPGELETQCLVLPKLTSLSSQAVRMLKGIWAGHLPDSSHAI